ncbi:hypothetical protein [Massilibacteroides sp.]|uniref:hypothetical protein n=1 Tax=Massilibacteroides sp. TaxID=2034766 RepID=UPI00260C4863|nr:hypothetical protein [Massilibacteroides sp.]MDD4516754.1 hypothetical protein [Massilibacteroides sp.]
MKIVAKYNISLDSVVGDKMPGTAMISTNIMEVSDPIASYKEYLNSQIELFKELSKRENPKAYLAFNLIPYVFYSSHYTLSKFRLYRWLHQMNNSANFPSFKEMEFSEDVWNLHTEMIGIFSALPDISYIFDKSLFLKQVKDIFLFVQLGLVDDDSLSLLRQELLQLLDDIIQMTSIPLDSPIKRSLYVANVSFESSYIYFEAKNFQASSMRIMGISIITTKDPLICEQQKKWIESLKRYSTLISMSGEIDRFTFINQQKEYINQLIPSSKK